MAKSEVFDSIMQGLKEVKAYKEGKLKLRSTKLRIEPVPTFSAKRVKTLREDLMLTQNVFARLCGVSIKTVEAWEAGTNVPSGASSRLFEIIEKDPKVVTRTGILTVS
jgi:putative transcriptional regulator